MVRWFKGREQAAQPAQSLPTVKFDRASVTASVKADLRANIEAIEDIDSPHIEPIYRAAVEAISRGGDLHLLTNAIMELEIPGVARARAVGMARWLSRSASALISDQRQAAMGIESAKWLYSGAPCHSGGANASAAQLRQDEAHRAANGKVYRVGKGVLLDGKWTLPGREGDCKCVSTAIIPGLDG
jgi:hypothetical protein